MKVKVSPASKDYEVRYHDGVYWIKVKELPVKGKANEGLVNFIAEKLGINKNSVKIVSGYSSKLKVIEISGDFSEEEIQRRLL